VDIIKTLYYINGALRDRRNFLLFYMCQLSALHVFIKRQLFYIYSPTGASKKGRLRSIGPDYMSRIRQGTTARAGVALPIRNEYRVIQIRRRVATVGNLSWQTVNAVWLAAMNISANILNYSISSPKRVFHCAENRDGNRH